MMPLGFVQDMVDRADAQIAISEPFFTSQILRDVLHRAGTVQRHKRHDILDAVGLHAPQRVHHARAFHLKHRNRFALA